MDAGIGDLLHTGSKYFESKRSLFTNLTLFSNEARNNFSMINLRTVLSDPMYVYNIRVGICI